jgi:ABC-type phosphate/phosphonate transport system substrate-binding protein
MDSMEIPIYVSSTELFLKMGASFGKNGATAAQQGNRAQPFPAPMLFLLWFITVLHFFSCEPVYAKSRVMHAGLLEETFWGTNKQDAKLALEVLFRSLSKKANETYSVEVIVYRDLPSMVPDIRKGEIDLASLFCYDYIRIQDAGLMEPILVGVKNGTAYEKYCLVVRRDGAINNVRQLKNKSMTISLLGAGDNPCIWLDTLLMKKERKMSKEYFGAMKKVNNVKKALLPVYFGQADACVITSRSFATESEMNPDIGRKLMSIEESPELLSTIICIRSNFDPSLKDKLIKNAITVHENPDGKQVLSILRLDSIAQYEPDLIKSFLKLLKEYSTLRAKK